MHSWREFKDSRFALLFKYPGETHQGNSVEKTESRQDEVVRVHFVARDSQEVYFEVTKYGAVPARVEYQQHKQNLEKRFEPFTITELKEIVWKSLPAHEYSFEWNGGARSVLLVERGDGTYRILYDPRSPVNLQVLSTVEWTNH